MLLYSSTGEKPKMAVMRNGKPIDEDSFSNFDGSQRAEEMRKYRREKGWGAGESANAQSADRLYHDTPRHSRHNRNIRPR